MADEAPGFVQWLVGIGAAVALAVAGRSYQIHDGLDERVRNLESKMLTRDELRDSLHDFMISINRSEDRFDGRLEELKQDMEKLIEKFDRHFEQTSFKGGH